MSTKKKAILTTGTAEYYGDAAQEDMERVDRLMVEYLENLGYEVEILRGLKPRLEIEGEDEDQYDLRQEAWEYAIARY